MMQHSDQPTRTYTPLPYSVLCGEEYVPSCGPVQPGTSHLDLKVDRYRTSAGVLSLADIIVARVNLRRHSAPTSTVSSARRG